MANGSRKLRITTLGVVYLLMILGVAVWILVSFYPLSLIFAIVLIGAAIVLAIRNGINSASKSPLLRAASHGDLETCRRLIESGTPVDEKTAFGDTSLICAAIQGDTEIMSYLLSKGAQINVHGEGGRTPLIAAVQKDSDNQLAVMELLVKSGAEIDARDNARFTALAYVVRDGNIDGVRLLIEKGAKASQTHGAADKSYSLLSLVPVSRPDIKRLLEASGANETIDEWTGGR